MFEEIEKYAKKNFIPIIRPKSRQILMDEVKKTSPSKILEIGSAIGYSGLCMLFASSASLVTIEKDEGRANMARQNFERYNVAERVQLINDDALKVLTNLAEEGLQFDFVFLDGPKGQYHKYLPLLTKLLVKGGTLFADNVSVMGLVDSTEPIAHKHRTMVVNMRKFLSDVSSSTQFESQILKVEDGILIAKRK